MRVTSTTKSVPLQFFTRITREKASSVALFFATSHAPSCISCGVCHALKTKGFPGGK